MGSEEIAKLVEEQFKKISGSEVVDYTRRFYGTGMGAYKFTTFEEGGEDKFWEAGVVRWFGKDLNESVPTGKISSLKLWSGYMVPHKMQGTKPFVTTKIDYHWAKEKSYLDERIKMSIETQKAMKDLIKEEIDYLTGADNIPFSKLTVNDFGGDRTSLTVLMKNKKGKKPEYPVSVIKKFGGRFENSFVKVQGVIGDDLMKAIPDLDFQTKKFETLQ